MIRKKLSKLFARKARLFILLYFYRVYFDNLIFIKPSMYVILYYNIYLLGTMQVFSFYSRLLEEKKKNRQPY